MADQQGPPAVTLVANDIGPEGGMERQLTELVTGLLERGHPVTVISWTCSLPPHPLLRWVRVPGPSRPFALAYPLFLLFASLLVRLRGQGVVHSTGAIVLNRVSICTVHFCHRAFSELPSFSRASRPGLAYRLNARVTRAMSRLAESWCYRPGRSATLVGVSEGVARELRRHFPKMGERITVVPNGVDTDEFRPAEPARSAGEGERLRALFVGSEWERKGLKIAIESLRDADAVELIVVGTGDERAYREVAESCAVADRVEFAGATTDVVGWYQRADVFLLPTVYETFSLVTYEAAACGLALLVTKVNGVEDLLRHGENGWFVERDPVEIGARLRELSEDRGLRERMAGAARRDSLVHDWSRVVDEYEGLYSSSPGRA